MSCSDYDYLRQFVLAHAANLVRPVRKRNVRREAEASGANGRCIESGEFVNILRSEPSAHLQRAVTEAMTIHETSFFRDRVAFNALRETILPRLIEANAGKQRLRIWSAATSTGQEAYSVAMLLCEHFGGLPNWDVTIVGTDISREVIDYARRGCYRRLEVNRGLPARLLVKYFSRDDDEWEVTPRLRAMCEFQSANLGAQLPGMQVFDLVMLRNVLLYFPQEGRSAAFREVHRQMTPDGYLLLGAAEQAEDSTDLFRPEFAKGCYYYRPSERPYCRSSFEKESR